MPNPTTLFVASCVDTLLLLKRSSFPNGNRGTVARNTIELYRICFARARLDESDNLLAQSCLDELEKLCEYPRLRLVK